MSMGTDIGCFYVNNFLLSKAFDWRSDLNLNKVKTNRFSKINQNHILRWQKVQPAKTGAFQLEYI